MVFWRHWFIEGEPSTHVQGAFEIFLTSLYPRCFPLVRYRIGDLISEDPNAAGFNQTFERLIGRCNDCIALPDGGTIHSEAFTHAVKECRFVLGFQVVQNASGTIRFHYLSSANDGTNEAEIRQRLAKIHPNLRDIELKHVTSLPQTIAGKTRSIVREAVDAH
jgi:phenylacetate-coenzyme A ligase PaaK-like adenylate-forming protein